MYRNRLPAEGPSILQRRTTRHRYALIRLDARTLMRIHRNPQSRLPPPHRQRIKWSPRPCLEVLWSMMCWWAQLATARWTCTSYRPRHRRILPQVSDREGRAFVCRRSHPKSRQRRLHWMRMTWIAHRGGRKSHMCRPMRKGGARGSRRKTSGGMTLPVRTRNTRQRGRH